MSNVPRQIDERDQWLFDAHTNDLVGVKNPTGRGEDFLPVRLNAAGTSLVSGDREMASRALLNHKGIGTRIQFGRFGTISNATAKTFHVTAEAACHFDAIRPVFGSYDSARSYQFSVVKASVLSSVADDTAMLNNAGTWVTGTVEALTAVPLKVALGGSTTSRIGYTVPDWMQLSSVDRTDGGTLPLIAIRCYSNDTSATALPVYGNGTDDFTNWATRSSRKWFARHFSGDGVSTPANFTGGTSATPQSQSPIIGFQYQSRGTVITVCGVGDSITEGRGTYLGEGFMLPACEAIQTATGLAIEYMQAGYSGQSLYGSSGGINGFSARALDILNSEIVPDVLVMPVGSPNDEPTTLTAAGIALQQLGVQSVIAECKRRGVALALWTWMPTNYAVDPRGSTDALRAAYNAACLLKYRNICDLATIHTGPLDGNSQYTMLYTTDGIHPNDAGNTLDAAAIVPYIKSAIFGG